ncbi:hypothetical protein ACFLSJ_06750 [Verrucomicrobiota bacterium]
MSDPWRIVGGWAFVLAVGSAGVPNRVLGADGNDSGLVIDASAFDEDAEPVHPGSPPDEDPSSLKMPWRGGTYEGKFRYCTDRGKYLPEGSGVLTGWDVGDGTTGYKGQWRDGMRQGAGIAVLRSGMRWKGQWRDDTAFGQGTLLLPDGEPVRDGMDFASALAWTPCALSETVAVLGRIPSHPGALAVVRRTEEELLQQAVTSQRWLVLAEFLSRASGCVNTPQHPLIEQVRGRARETVDGLLRSLLAPPSFDVGTAAAVAEALGPWGEPWRALIKAISVDHRDERIPALLPSGDRPFPACPPITRWSEYAVHLKWLAESLSALGDGHLIPRSMPSEEVFRRSWRGWLGTTARLALDDHGLDREEPVPPSLRWVTTPSQGERVLIEGQAVDARKDRFSLEESAWGESVECVVISEDGARWAYEIRLLPHSGAPPVRIDTAAVELMSLAGLPVEEARARVDTWSRAGVLSREIEQTARDLTELRTIARVVHRGHSATPPAVEVGVPGGERAHVGDLGWMGPGETNRLQLAELLWGESVTVLATNRIGVRREWVLVLLPNGAAAERMAALLGLPGLNVEQGTSRLQEWREWLTPEALREAGTCLTIPGDVRLEALPEPISWPRIRFSGGDRRAWIVWSGKEGRHGRRPEGVIELTGWKWGETLRYRIENSFGVWRPGLICLLHDKEQFLDLVRSTDWARLAHELEAIVPFLDEARCEALKAAVRSRILDQLPEAIQQPDHPLRAFDPLLAGDAVQLDGVRDLLQATAELHALDTDVAPAASRTSMEYEFWGGYRDKASSVRYADRQPDVDDLIVKHAMLARALVCDLDPSLMASLRAVVIGTVERRARAVHGALGHSRNSVLRRLPMVPAFLAMVRELKSEGLLAGMDRSVVALIEQVRSARGEG